MNKPHRLIGQRPIGTGVEVIVRACRGKPSAEREHVLVGREYLVSRVEACSSNEDPIGITSNTNTDEYRPEASPRDPTSRRTTSSVMATGSFHEEFVRWVRSADRGARLSALSSVR